MFKKIIACLVIGLLVSCSTTKTEPQGEYRCSNVDSDLTLVMDIQEDTIRLYTETESVNLSLTKLANNNYKTGKLVDEPLLFNYDQSNDVIYALDEEGERTGVVCKLENNK